VSALARALLGPPARSAGCLLVGGSLLAAAGVATGFASRHDRQALLWSITFAVCLGALLVLAQTQARPPDAARGSHGSARWGDPRRHLGTSGLILGRWGRALLRYDGEGHILTLGPTGSGKGVNAVIPNLLAHRGSVVVLDLKGENYAVTAAHRQRFSRVVTLDPFRLTGAPDAALNPLDLIEPDSETCDADAATLAHLLVLPAAQGEAAFWDEEAAALLSGLILYVAATEPTARRHLGTVRAYLTLSPPARDEILAGMSACERAHGLIARAAHRLAQKADRERSGVVSTAQRHTHFLDSPAILRTLCSSTVDLAELKTETLSLYCVLPPQRLGSHGRWLRLLAGTAVDAMLRTPGLPRERVLFLLDEFAQLGRIQPIEQALTLLRGYGVRLWLLVQDLAQLRAHYGPMTDSILANAAVLQSLGTNDVETAQYLSRRTGQATVLTASQHRSSGQSYSHAWIPTRQQGRNQAASETGRPLIMPDEILRLDTSEQLLFLVGCEPLLVGRVNYLHDPEFRGAYAPNPLHRSV
jgi:type IV secretion system protein VirD4